MYLIGLTGGIASGKSVVAKRLADHGAFVIDADVLAREVVEPGSEALGEIARQFGPEVLSDDGSLNRPALGAIVFPDPQKRAILNSITHPAIWKRALELLSAAEARDPHGVAVYDVPLLAEASEDRPMRFDLVVVVHADADIRLDRLMTLRGMTRDEAQHRLNSQATDAERLAFADVVIDSSTSLEETLRQADELWTRAAAAAASVRPD